MFTLIKNGRLYAPEDKGRQDILIAAGKIIGIRPGITLPGGLFRCEVVDAADSLVVPGFIDQHVHIAGGGGEGGPATRTPEIQLSHLTTAGITTVVGLLGADGVTRSVAGLLAKARALEAEGITAYIYTGAYQLPTRTVTGSVRSDLVFIDKIIGTGEIAISDHRSAQPSVDRLAQLASEARIGGMLGQKAGIVHLHVGEGKAGLAPLFEVIERTDIPASQFVPTHVNRLAGLLEEAAEFLKLGGPIDLTAGISPAAGERDALSVDHAVQNLVRARADLSLVTVSSDGNGSLPHFNLDGSLHDLGISSVGRLWEDVRQTVIQGIVPLATAISLITRNVAAVLKLLPRKGILAEGSDADLVLLDNDLNIDKVYAHGQLMVDNGRPVVRGYFE